jgi:SAM-dependent methyltransferase
VTNGGLATVPGMGTGARYDAVAEAYEAQNPDAYTAGPDVALLSMVGDVSGQRLLDVACGHGRITRELARRGARATGVDISIGMLDRARASEAGEPLGVTYVEADIASPATLPNEAFDAVVCHFGLSDIDDLDGALATVARILRHDGTFVFTVLHPCFPGWGHDVAASWAPAGGGYFREGWWATTAVGSTLRRQVGANHRMLSTYLNALVGSGLAIDATAEPPPPDAWARTAPDRDPVPVFLVVRARKRQPTVR